MRAGQFYYRRRVPADARSLIGRAEIWRSLRTDSLKTALRRLPSARAKVEVEIERSRWLAGLTVDETLLQPFSNDAPVARSAAPPQPSS
ncbi:DUF6538 domain-containing protein [Novosphingobium percolationis]|uniref:DUF6538 domain-containing protein n=1 Tax=Novosphingobium percolationis TaxID=2871811 RepID=UPI0038509E07